MSTYTNGKGEARATLYATQDEMRQLLDEAAVGFRENEEIDDTSTGKARTAFQKALVREQKKAAKAAKAAEQAELNADWVEAETAPNAPEALAV